MTEDDTLPTAPAADTAAPAESETSEANTEVTKTEAQAKTETEQTTDPGADNGDEDGDDQDGEGKPKRPSRYQRLKRERDALQAEISQIRNRPMAEAAGDEAALDAMVRGEIGDPPKEDDPRFKGDWFAYERALTAYETEKRIVARDLRKQATQAKADYQQSVNVALSDFRDQQVQARKSIADFDAVVSKATMPATDTVQRLILESEKGALIQYHLAKNPEQLERLNSLSPLGVAKEIGRLEDRLSLPNPQTATKAASPISSPRGGAAPTADLSKMSMADYVAHRNKGAA